MLIEEKITDGICDECGQGARASASCTSLIRAFLCWEHFPWR